ncbi:MAG: ABC transporter substrate-binding protein [Mariprofundaceae bacterium]
MKTVITTLILSLLLALPASAEVLTPDAVVKETMNGIIDILKEREDSSTISETEFDAIHHTIVAGFDFTEMAKRSLAKGWKKINAQQRTDFTTTFRQLIERSYSSRLSGYSDEIVEFGEVKIDVDRAKVETVIVAEDNDIPINYSLHLNKESWKIYDVKIEGVSLVSTFRSSFRKIIKKDGFEGLHHHLKKKLAKIIARSVN